MSQLMQVARPGRNAVRQAKKAKEIRQVKAAIVWHERERKKRQEVRHERWEAVTNFRRETAKYNNKEQRRVSEALGNMREDWRLGPLRPNRAVGEGADKYGALTAEQVQQPIIPIHKQRHKNEDREKQGLEPEYPLVVDGERIYHIARDDRVVVIHGREKGKIGIVQGFNDDTHRVIVKGVNMQYYDSDNFNNMGQDVGAKRESEVPMPLADVRLVIPYELTKDNRKIFSDVIVDNLVLERHTTGVDPFTFTDYGDAEFPPEHRYDPKTGLPIFHRYIAGTRQRIEWPWEHNPEIEDRDVIEEDATDKQTWFRKTLGTLRHPINSFRGLASSSSEVSTKKDSTPEPVRKEELEEIELEEKERLRKPKGQDIQRNEAFDNTDTTRNIVETAESIQYRLITPPFPEALGQELRSDIQDLVIESSKDKDGDKLHSKKLKKMTQQARAHSEKDKAKRIAAERMKTPMQLRWEKDHAKKLQEREKTPLVSTEALMAALGQHMQKAQSSSWKPKRQAAKAQELD